MVRRHPALIAMAVVAGCSGPAMPRSDPRAASGRGPANADVAVFQICIDAHGKLTRLEPVKRSGHPDRDAEAMSKLRGRQHAPRRVNGKPVASCGAVRVVHGAQARKAPASAGPAPAERHEPKEGCAEQPAGCPDWQEDGMVRKEVLEPRRLEGSTQIQPDDDTKRAIYRDGISRVIGSYKLCLDATGVAESVEVIKSTGYPDYDDKLIWEMRGWRFTPMIYDGKPIPICSVYTFIYNQKDPIIVPAPPPPPR